MTIYLYIPQQKGSITEQSYHDWIKVIGFSFSAEKSSRSSTQGHEIFIYKHFDQTSPFFLTQSCSGQVIPHIKIDILKTAHTPYIQYVLENVLISEYDSFTISDDTPIESIGFNYTHLTIRSISYEQGIAKPITFRMEIGSKPNHETQLKRHIISRSDEGFKLFVATVYGEAANQSESAWKAIGSVIINRVNNQRFVYKTNGHYFKFKTTDEVIQVSGFDAYKDHTSQFNDALAFLNNKTKDAPPKLCLMIEKLGPIYYDHQLTTDATLYFSPKAQHSLHIKYPKKYPQVPEWHYQELVETKISNISASDDLIFYKYK